MGSSWVSRPGRRQPSAPARPPPHGRGQAGLIAPAPELQTLAQWHGAPSASSRRGGPPGRRGAAGHAAAGHGNPIATADDEDRIAFTDEALRRLSAAIADGVDVRGYVHWRLLDNFEWMLGHRPTSGLVSVDRETFARTLTPSLVWLGEVARRNGLDQG
jgi:beta-glucosidase